MLHNCDVCDWRALAADPRMWTALAPQYAARASAAASTTFFSACASQHTPLSEARRLNRVVARVRALRVAARRKVRGPQV